MKDKIIPPWCLVILTLGAAGFQTLAQTPADSPLPKEPVKAEVLTPKPAPVPRINGPKVFGVRPGSPFLYSVPATGERPMKFSADKLPEGLQIDAATGRIAGVLKTPGEHAVTLRAENAHGKAEKPFRIVAGEQIALTPPMGWNSWNCWGKEVDQEKVLRSARAMAASGLDQHGWTYINIDDAWQGTRGGEWNAIQSDPKKFPNMKELTDQIHAMGLKAGIYSTPWVTSYAGRIGGSSENPQGTWDRSMTKGTRNKKVLPFAIAPNHFTTQDARQWAAWGFDYLKYDWGPVEAEPAREMAEALRASGRDIVYSLSNNAAENLFNEIAEVSKYANAWRTWHDIRDSWKSVLSNGFSQDQWAPFQGPGRYNDPDMLVVGEVGWGKPHPTNLTPDEQYAHISLWCLLASPMLIGCDLEKLDDFTLSLLANDEVIEIDQDPLCKQGTRVANEGDLDVYAKPLEDGSWAVGLFNRGKEQATVAVKWSDLKLTGKQRVRDLWRQKELGAFEDKFEAPVASHGAALIRVRP